MTSALWTQTDVIRIASTLLEPSSAPVILDSSLIWTKRRVKVGATSRGNTVTSRVIHLRFIVRKWLWPRDWGGVTGGRGFKFVLNATWGFFPRLKLNSQKSPWHMKATWPFLLTRSSCFKIWIALVFSIMFAFFFILWKTFSYFIS